MRIEFSYKKNDEVMYCKFENLKSVALCRRMMINYIYDHDIEQEYWVNGYIYDGDICLGQIDYLGNFIKEVE